MQVSKTTIVRESLLSIFSLLVNLSGENIFPYFSAPNIYPVNVLNSSLINLRWPGAKAERINIMSYRDFKKY